LNYELLLTLTRVHYSSQELFTKVDTKYKVMNESQNE